MNESKKMNKKKRTKRKEMLLEDYAKENNINIDFELIYEDDNKKTDENRSQSNYLIYQQNIIKSKKNNENKFHKKESDLEENLNQFTNVKKSYYSDEKNKIFYEDNTEYKKYYSSSTNNSSSNEEDNKINNESHIKKVIKNAINQNKVYKITSAINNAKILDQFKNPNFYNYKGYSNYFINNNYNNFNLNSFNNYNNLSKYNYFLTYNFYLYSGKLENIKNNLNEIEKKIKELENNSLYEQFIIYQSEDLFNYIKQKNQNLIENETHNNEVKKDKENPEHPYFYINHDEEKQINNVLYLVEGLFIEDNLKHDFYLLNMLNRDGYVSLKQLENHPQLINCKIKENHLKTVFVEHRENEITATVETFEEILIRNRDWIKIKKGIKDIENIKENSLNSTKFRKDLQIKKLKEQKENYLNYQKKIFYKNQVNNIKIQQLKKAINFNINNIYNNNFNLYNNNVYNNF